MRTALLCVLLGTGCGNSSGADPAKSFVGSWVCTGTFTNRVTSPQPGTRSGSYTEILEIRENADGSLNDEVHFQNGQICTKRAVVSGTTASFAGQSCPSPDIMGATTYTMGLLTLSGNQLLESGSATVMGTLSDDGGTETVAGTQTFDATCVKQ